jgi:hypothetical protein
MINILLFVPSTSRTIQFSFCDFFCLFSKSTAYETETSRRTIHCCNFSMTTYGWQRVISTSSSAAYSFCRRTHTADSSTPAWAWASDDGTWASAWDSRRTAKPDRRRPHPPRSGVWSLMMLRRLVLVVGYETAHGSILRRRLRRRRRRPIRRPAHIYVYNKGNCNIHLFIRTLNNDRNTNMHIVFSSRMICCSMQNGRII